jgi:hypothetical protein
MNKEPTIKENTALSTNVNFEADATMSNWNDNTRRSSVTFP